MSAKSAPPPPTTLRLDLDLRDYLTRQAAINGRSLSQELVTRLRASREQEGAYGQAAPKPAPRVHEPLAQIGGTDQQRRLLLLYDRLQPEQQLALLTLLAR